MNILFKVLLKMVKNKVKEKCYLIIVMNILVSLIIIKWKEKVYINGKKDKVMKVNGKCQKCMEKEFIIFWMELHMKDFIIKEKDMVKESFIIKVTNSTKATG